MSIDLYNTTKKGSRFVLATLLLMMIYYSFPHTLTENAREFCEWYPDNGGIPGISTEGDSLSGVTVNYLLNDTSGPVNNSLTFLKGNLLSEDAAFYIINIINYICSSLLQNFLEHFFAG